MGFQKCSAIKFSGPIEKKGEYFVAYCDQIPIAAFGENEEKAAEKAIKAITLYLNTHKELGQLPEIIDRYKLVPEMPYEIKHQRFEARCPLPV